MLASAMNFAIGFFGYPFDGQYQQSITIEANGVRSSTVRTVVKPSHFFHFSSTTPFPLTRRMFPSCILELHAANHLFTFSCPNARIDAKAERGEWYIKRWANIYLEDARKRLQKQLHGLELSIEDVYIMQQMCPYEVCPLFRSVDLKPNFLFQTVALGFSKFCELFTEEEWEGFNYG
jgi:hypothetical protein